MKSKNIISLLFVTAILVILLNYPIIEIANKHQLIYGVPLLPIYIFTVWILSILILYFISNTHFNSKNKNE